MARSYFCDFPPYPGDEPYVYLCFHEDDAKAVEPFLDALTRRRCRIWYSMGNVFTPEENQARAARVEKAALMICYLTPRAANSEGIHNSIGSYQASGKPVICIVTEAIGEQSGLSLFANENVRRLPRAKEESVETLVSALLRTDGFSQLLLAENDMERQIFLHKRKSRRHALAILAFSVLALATAFLYSLWMGYLSPKEDYADEIMIYDAVIQEAARDALSQNGSKALTQEAVEAIPTLHLEGTPSSFDELSLFPSLTRLEIPQSCMEAAAQLLEDAAFTVVVYPEEGK